MLSHSLQLSGLSPATTYFYKVISADASDNESSSDVESFTTPNASFHETSQADFADGTNAGTAVRATGGGAVELATGGVSHTFTQADGPPTVGRRGRTPPPRRRRPGVSPEACSCTT